MLFMYEFSKLAVVVTLRLRMKENGWDCVLTLALALNSELLNSGHNV